MKFLYPQGVSPPRQEKPVEHGLFSNGTLW